MREEDTPARSPVGVDADGDGDGWNEQSMAAILDQGKTARRALTEQLRALPLGAWNRTATLGGETISLFALVYRMTQNDFHRLRDLGHRLHGAHLSDRDEPLPT